MPATSVPQQPISAIPPLGLITKLFYGFGSIAYGVKDVAFKAYILIFYNQVVGVDAGLVSLAILLALVVDAIADPIIGQWSDTLRSRWGRRHPFMYASALPTAATFLLVWMPPAGLSGAAMFGWIFCVATLLRTFITLYEIPSSSLAPELSRDYDERTSIMSYRYFFGYLGGLGMSFAALWVFLRPTPEFPIGQLNPEGYWHFAIAGAILMVASIVVSAGGTHHRIKYLRKIEAAPPRPVLATLREMGQTFSHRGFMALMAFGTLKYTAIGVSAALALYFGTYFWDLSARGLAVLSLDGIIAAAGSIVIAPWLSKRFGKTRAAKWLAVIAVIIAVLPFILRLAGLFVPNGSPWLLPLLFIMQGLFGLCGISSAILTASMVADVVEDSELRTGRRSEGLFYAAASLMQKCVSGLGVFVAGMLIQFSGLQPGTKPADVDPQVIDTLVLSYIPVVALLYFIGAAFLNYYTLDRSAHDDNLRRLDEAAATLATAADGSLNFATPHHTQSS